MHGLGGLACLLAGLLWIIKGGGIILGAPGWIEDGFRPAQTLFAIGLIGLHARLEGHGGRLAVIALVLALISALLSAASIVYDVANSGRDDPYPALSSAFDGGASFSWFSSWIILGIAHWRTKLLPGRWRMTPLVTAILAPLLFVLAVIHLEVPIVLIGLMWVLLGYLIWFVPGREAQRNARIAA